MTISFLNKYVIDQIYFEDTDVNIRPPLSNYSGTSLYKLLTYWVKYCVKFNGATFYPILVNFTRDTRNHVS